MPELPEVEHERRFFAEHAAARRVTDVVVTDAGILRNVEPETLRSALRGRRFDDPDRHGKWLLAWTNGPVLLVHFGMTGTLEWGEDASGRHPWDRAIVVLEDGELRYRNVRKLGGLWLAHDAAEAEAILGPLGPDALDVRRRQFHDLLSRRRGQIKPVFLGQRLVAGVGNLLADEALWQARIHPSRRIETLSDTDRDRLYDAMKAVVREAVRRRDYVRQKRRWLVSVRGTPDAACPRCGTPLVRSVVGGRTTYHCPSCQR